MRKSQTTWLFLALFVFTAETAGAQERPTIKVARLGDLAIQVMRSVPATAVSLRMATIASELSAQVTRMELVPGDLVSENQVIAELDCSDSDLLLQSANSQVAALQARQKLARQQLARLNQLKQSRNATEEQINQRQAELDVVRAEIATQRIAISSAERQVARCRIRAPFSGLIISTAGQIGNYLTPGSPVVSLVDIELVELKAGLLEHQVKELIENPPWFHFAGENWPLAVRTVFPVIDEMTQTREIRFRFSGDKPAPGSVGRLQWQLGGMTLPSTYLVQRQDKIGVFTVNNSEAATVQFIAVENALQGQPVTLDLPADTLIVTDGRFGLQDKQEVIIE